MKGLCERKSTGIKAYNGMIHVGDSVMYEDGWLCFVAKIVEVDGTFGFLNEDNVFHNLQDFTYPEYDPSGMDFEILPENHKERYGIHAPLYGEDALALLKGSEPNGS